MRVLFCKIHCPFICFCKSSSHIYAPGPLKLENTRRQHHVPSSTVDASDQLSVHTVEVREEDGKQRDGNLLRSSLRKAQPSEDGAVKEVSQKKVQWMDFLGQELVEIKEFESSETEDANNEVEESRGCLCTIL
ncbi:uncharacterized protein LOC131147597 [Malania oleifera]|uniref:uncharacterized protein LOC131147597 n=1 Tax=Malania oleifera TaxID=397392 RepID=UPI0025ADF575|nr:uncharacterized protein LOC131147597 [Malania oleifera]